MRLRTAIQVALATCALVGVAQAETTLSYTHADTSTYCEANARGSVVCVTQMDGVAPPHSGMRPVPTLPPPPVMPMDDPLLPLGTEGFNPDASVSSPPFAGTDGGGSSGAPGIAIPEPMEPPMLEPTPDMAANCALERAQALVGMAWDDSLLDGIAAPGAVRVLRPNDAATMDYSPSRLNILLNDQGVVQEASCG